MYAEILCPRCQAAVAGRVLRERTPPAAPAPIEEPLSARDVIESEDEESLTETDIVEAEPAVAANAHDDSAKTE
jgi:hypothetical protein